MAWIQGQQSPMPNPGGFLQPWTNTPSAGTGQPQTASGNNPYPEGSRQWNVYQNFADYGYNPTPAEINTMVSFWSDKGIGGSAGAIAQYMLGKQQVQEAQANSPEALYARQQQEWQQAAPKHYDAVNQMVQQLLGRPASQDELTHYGTILASGQADAYTVGQFIQSLPEYQNAQDTKFRQGLDQQLQDSDLNFFNRAKGSIAERYALMGRATSPAVDVAMTDLAAQLSEKRQNYLAQLSAGQYGGNKAAALGQYESNRQNLVDRSNASTNANYGAYTGNVNRFNNLQDYNTQAMNWQNAMEQFSPKPGALDYLNTAFNGMNALANVGKTAFAASGG